MNPRADTHGKARVPVVQPDQRPTSHRPGSLRHYDGPRGHVGVDGEREHGCHRSEELLPSVVRSLVRRRVFRDVLVLVGPDVLRPAPEVVVPTPLTRQTAPDAARPVDPRSRKRAPSTSTERAQVYRSLVHFYYSPRTRRPEAVFPVHAGVHHEGETGRERRIVPRGVRTSARVRGDCSDRTGSHLRPKTQSDETSGRVPP